MPNRNDQKGRRNHYYLVLFISVFVGTIALVTLTVFGVSRLMRGIGEKSGLVTTDETTESITGDTTVSESDTAAPVTEETTVETTDEATKEMQTVSIDGELNDGYGTLLLVNADHPYTISDEDDIGLITIYERKNHMYKVASSEIMLNGVCIDMLNAMMTDFNAAKGLNDVNVTNGYRDYEEQMEIYSAYVAKYGITAAKGNVAEGGCSDHNTGLGFDLAVYTSDDGLTHELDYMDDYLWITDNCYKYGFIRRFDPEKSDITGINGEEWHFRYVGVPHAYYMKKNDLCLEEYITELSNYPYDGDHLTFSDDEGGRWEIFTVTLNNGGEAEFEIPKEAAYTVSGTNTGVIVVTVDLNAQSQESEAEIIADSY